MLAEDDWKALRSVRLRALEDSPAAFLAKTETSWGEPEWRAAVRDGDWIVARHGEQVIGVVHCVRGDDRPADERHFESVWVDPLHRRSGVLRAFLSHLVAYDPAVRTLMVWILDGNDAARATYERLGFESTGERQPLPGAPRRVEERLRLALNANHDSTDPAPES